MQSSLIGKIEKAKRYAAEPERVVLNSFTAAFKGDNNDYKVSYNSGKWLCTCNFFSQMGICSHIMALQKIYEKILPPEAQLPLRGSIPV
ncbi:MAG TPA: SWIM zinc finger family protein [Dehalococcoidia bacterium]|nr:SWIM zinc finger family protein [Dehalococcoidia bacterium]